MIGVENFGCGPVIYTILRVDIGFRLEETGGAGMPAIAGRTESAVRG